jgi:hypothetical protein
VICGMSLTRPEKDKVQRSPAALVVRLLKGMNLVAHTKAHLLRRIEPGNSRRCAVSAVMRSSPCTCAKADAGF